ncbi:pilus (MSHA type) biogenesis protein MshL [Vibrio porteresiae]|uniref:Pilus (MSHA type) biogenesis protein MshL n=1 Tax=Vibrio porteresiae DSM 19223 TaxID=1123496 RepID=A0ABZ0QD86_9VIBR|nr:pilus (MSHA type) biogenesis protein MshL [Vibrio porteresiae]WPC74439.1 pilus (MSHA type) biogenesis protein MshL [Vibrio porteresiae DSM 19223]
MRRWYLGTLILGLAGCSMGHRDPVEVKQALNEAVENSQSKRLASIPDAVAADLMPDSGISMPSDTPKQLKRFRIQTDGVDARAFFTSLVRGTGYSVALHPDVSGKITVNLSDVTLDDVLNVVRDLYGYEIEKTGQVIQVYPAGLRTVTIPVDYLQFKRLGRSLTAINTGTITSNTNSSNSSNSSSSSSSSSNSIASLLSSDSGDNNNSSDGSTNTSSLSGGTEIETTSKSDFWDQLQKAITQLVGSGRGQSVVVSPQAGVITVRAFPEQIREIRRFLGISEQRLHRQVILEAKVLEVTLNDSYQQGINWSNLSLGNSKVTFGVDGTTSLPGMDTIGTLLGGTTSLSISDGSFSGVLSFMSTQGDINVLSSPRITAANNQKAVIKVGTDEYYVTNLTSTVGSGDNAESAPDIELTPFFSGISLDVTPQIDDQGNVLLHVHPAVIDVEEDSKSITYQDQEIELPLAKSSIRESDSVIRAKDGDVVVIGGLMKTSISKKQTKVPLLGDIPGLGHLFRSKSNATEKTELVILLKPTVVGVNTWQKELERSQDLLQQWIPDTK